MKKIESWKRARDTRSINAAHGGVGVPGAVRRGAEISRRQRLEQAGEALDIDEALMALGEAAVNLSVADLVELRGGPVIDPANQADQARWNNFAAGRPIDSHEGLRSLMRDQLIRR